MDLMVAIIHQSLVGNRTLVSRDFVELTNGERLPLARLPQMVPYTCYRSDVHLDVCHRVADRLFPDPPHRDVYVNFLVVFSELTRRISALAYL